MLDQLNIFNLIMTLNIEIIKKQLSQLVNQTDKAPERLGK
jgi:hypothetical protein